MFLGTSVMDDSSLAETSLRLKFWEKRNFPPTRFLDLGAEGERRAWLKTRGSTDLMWLMPFRSQLYRERWVQFILPF